MDRQQGELGLLDYVRVVRRRKWIIVACIAACLISAIAFTAQATRIYAATAEILLSTSSDESPFSREGFQASDPATVETQVQVLRSQPVADEARAQLGRAAKEIHTTRAYQVSRTRVLRIEVKSARPSVARDAANTFAEVYVAQRRDAAVNSALDVAKQVLLKAEEAKQELSSIDQQLVQLRAARIPNQPAIDSLERSRDIASAQFTAFQQKYEEFEIDAQLRRGGAEVLTPAALPSTPVSPAPLRNAALGLAVGALLGIAAAFLMEYLDDTVRSVEDVERQSRGMSILATIPTVPDWRNRERTKLITIEDPSDVVSESYRSLRTSLQFIGLRQPLRTLLVTSPMASEGKTTTIANLAVTLARAGRKVVCVDCDLRRPRLNEFFGHGNEVGFTSVLLGDEPLSSALQPVSVGTGGSLQILSSGPLPPNPAELLGTTRVAELLSTLSADADFVLVDAPPLLPITDAVVLSSRVDGVLLVATSRVTSARHLARAADLLHRADAPTLGLVFNGAGSEGGYGYNYQYRYGMGDGDVSPRATAG